jgi:hypothetical protein
LCVRPNTDIRAPAPATRASAVAWRRALSGWMLISRTVRYAMPDRSSSLASTRDSSAQLPPRRRMMSSTVRAS